MIPIRQASLKSIGNKTFPNYSLTSIAIDSSPRQASQHLLKWCFLKTIKQLVFHEMGEGLNDLPELLEFFEERTSSVQ